MLHIRYPGAPIGVNVVIKIAHHEIHGKQPMARRHERSFINHVMKAYGK
jgi:hypothetical protein